MRRSAWLLLKVESGHPGYREQANHELNNQQADGSRAADLRLFVGDPQGNVAETEQPNQPRHEDNP